MSDARQARWQALRRIHDAVLHLAPASREAKMVELAAGDEDLLREARALLQACDVSEDTLPAPGLETVHGWYAGPEMDVPPVGRQLGPFRLIRKLAQGGMGVVFEAEQEEPKRRVALKVLRASLGSPSARLRFEHEAKVLANLTHPGIGALYGVGAYEAETGERMPYLIMELIQDARPITTYVRQSELSPRECLALFLSVAEAVMAGHQRGVIHRDLKPDNVLVDGSGRTKVIDFGIARVTAPDMDRGQVTETGLVMGTLGYIAPEQLQAGGAGDDVRMDVYALGVVLYEMLTGHRPLDLEGLDVMSAVRATLQDRRTPATRYVPSLPADVVLIVNKALAKEPEGRYASVDAFARDVSAFLHDEPIRARPPSWTYQLRLFAKRHRAGFLAAALIAASLAGAFWISVRAAGTAREAEAHARASSERTSAMLLSSQQLVQRLVADLYGELARIPGTLPTRMRLVEHLEDSADALRVQAGDDVRLLRTAADVHRHVGLLNYRNTGDHLGRPGQALQAIERAEAALALLLARTKKEATSRRREVELLRAALLGDRAAIYTYQGLRSEARSAASSAIDLLEALRTTWPESLPIRTALASQQMGLARMAYCAGQAPEALDRIKSGLALLPEKAPAEQEQARHVHGNRGFLECLAGTILRQQGHLDQARAHLEAGLEAFRAEAALDKESPDIRIKLSRAYGELGLLAIAEGKTDQAERHLAEAIRVGREQVARNPQDRQARESLYVDMSYMAKVYDAKGDLDQAAIWQASSVAGGEQFVEEEPDALFPRLELRVALNTLGGYLIRSGKADGAIKAFERAHELAKQAITGHPHDVRARLGWAEALDALGIARWSAARSQQGDARRALLLEAKSLFEASRDAHADMARDGVLPSTHEGAAAQIANKIAICAQNLRDLSSGEPTK